MLNLHVGHCALRRSTWLHVLLPKVQWPLGVGLSVPVSVFFRYFEVMECIRVSNASQCVPAAFQRCISCMEGSCLGTSADDGTSPGDLQPVPR